MTAFKFIWTGLCTSSVMVDPLIRVIDPSCFFVLLASDGQSRIITESFLIAENFKYVPPHHLRLDTGTQQINHVAEDIEPPASAADGDHTTVAIPKKSGFMWSVGATRDRITMSFSSPW